jgi:hypothetical protein
MDKELGKDFTKDAFVLHFLFDPYLSEQYGSPSTIALEKFINSLIAINDNRATNIIKMLLISSEIDKKFTEEIKNINDKIEKLDKYESKTNHESNLIIDSAIRNIVWKENILDNDFFLCSGYINPMGGHLIGLYIKKINNNYKVIVSNSGEGLNYHEKRVDGNKNKYPIILESKELSFDNIIKILVEHVKCNGVEKFSKINNFYYNVVRILNINVNNEGKYINEQSKYYSTPQYSGSCTFYGIYHFIKYYFTESNNLNVFKEWKHITKKNLLIKFIKSITDENVFNGDCNCKNFIDIIKHRYLLSSSQIFNIDEKKEYIIKLDNYYKDQLNNYLNIKGTLGNISIIEYPIEPIILDNKNNYEQLTNNIEIYINNNNISGIVSIISILVSECFDRTNNIKRNLMYWIPSYIRYILMKINRKISDNPDSIFYQNDINYFIDEFFKLSRLFGEHDIIHLIILRIIVRLNNIIPNNQFTIDPIEPSIENMNHLVNRLSETKIRLEYELYYNADINNVVYDISRYSNYYNFINNERLPDQWYKLENDLSESKIKEYLKNKIKNPFYNTYYLDLEQKKTLYIYDKYNKLIKLFYNAIGHKLEFAIDRENVRITDYNKQPLHPLSYYKINKNINNNYLDSIVGRISENNIEALNNDCENIFFHNKENIFDDFLRININSDKKLTDVIFKVDEDISLYKNLEKNLYNLDTSNYGYYYTILNSRKDSLNIIYQTLFNCKISKETFITCACMLILYNLEDVINLQGNDKLNDIIENHIINTEINLHDKKITFCYNVLRLIHIIFTKNDKYVYDLFESYYTFLGSWMKEIEVFIEKFIKILINASIIFPPLNYIFYKIVSGGYSSVYKKINKQMQHYFEKNKYKVLKYEYYGHIIYAYIQKNNQNEKWKIIHTELTTKSIFHDNYLFYNTDNGNTYTGIALDNKFENNISIIEKEKKIIIRKKFSDNVANHDLMNTYDILNNKDIYLKKKVNMNEDGVYKFVKYLEYIIEDGCDDKDVPVDINNKFGSYYKNLLVWLGDDRYMIELSDYKLGDSNTTLSFIYKDSDEIYYNNYKVITDTKALNNPLLSRWIYGSKNCLILVNEDDIFDNKILIIKHSYFKYEIFNNIWNKKPQHKYILSRSENYYIIDVHYSCLYLMFNNIEEFKAYFLNCIITSNSECLYLLANQYMTYIKNNEKINKEEKNIFDYVIKNNLFNNPFRHYYNYLFNSYSNEYVIHDDIDKYNRIEEYSRRLDEGKYPLKYNITLTSDNETYIHKFISDDTLNNINKTIILYSDNKISANIKNSDLQSFIENYKKCDKTNVNIDIEKINEFKKSIILKINEKHRTLYDKLNIDTNLLNCMLHNKEEIYKITELKTLLNIIDQILICSNTSCHCSEIYKLSELLNTEIIYSGIRTTDIITFELTFGSFVRKDQIDIYNKINQEHNYYNIYQVLMGRGKTSVITPLLTFNNILKFNNVILVMPKHLVKQSFDYYSRIFSPILYNINLFNVSISRDTIGYDRYINGERNIIIIDDTSFKSLRINTILNSNESFISRIIDNSFIIMDEIDTMINPLTSELNYPLNEKESISNNIFLFEFTVKLLISLIEERKILEFYDIMESKKIVDEKLNKMNYEGENKNEVNYLINYLFNKNHPINEVNLNWEIIGQLRKIYNTLINCLLMSYNKDYGLGNKLLNFDKNNYIAIPYSAVNNPVDGSEFTDPELTLILTTLSFLYNGLRQQDILNIIIYCNDIIKQSGYNTINNDNILLIKKYTDIISQNKFNYQLSYIFECYNNTITKDLSSEIGKNTEIIKNYLLDIILPKYIKINTLQYNCSFMDVINKTFTKHKTAFSGTVNIKLPLLKDNKFEFSNNIMKNNIANGEIISAITGTVNKNECKIVDDYIDIDNIIELSSTYNVLIDSGAFLKRYTTLDVIKKRFDFDNKPKNKMYVYIDDNDNKMIYTNDGIIESIRKLGKEILPSNVFIYYDNKHIIGIDIQQPYILKGIATVSNFNRFTDISQAIYRLRKLNYGHTIDFLVKRSVSDNITTVDLYKILIKAEEEYNKSTNKRYLLQNIKCLERMEKQNKNSYNEEVFYEKVKSKEDLSKDLYGEFILSHFCKKKDELCNQLLNETFDKFNINTSINVQKEQEKEKEKESQITKNIQHLINKNIQKTMIFSKSQYTISDYFMINIEQYYNKIYKIFGELFSKADIFLSPLSQLDLFSSGIYDNQSKTDINFLSYYVIINLDNNRHMLLFPNEYYTLNTFLSAYSINNIIIKTIYCETVYPNNYNHKITAQHCILKIFLTLKLSIQEYIILFKYIKEKEIINQFKSFCKYVEKYNGVRILNESFETWLINNHNNFDIILDEMYDNKQYTAIYKILGFNNITFTTDQLHDKLSYLLLKK